MDSGLSLKLKQKLMREEPFSLSTSKDKFQKLLTLYYSYDSFTV